MKNRPRLLHSFLERHRDEGTYLCFDYVEGRIIEFDEEYVLLRSCGEESEQPFDVLLRLDQVTCIYPAEDKLREDEKLRKLGEIYRRGNEESEPGRRSEG
ncbi:MAG TPA: hypothetical protein VNO81_08075 [Candidatus Nitrosotenuis sp.]|jgi:hypothetical protein|nr:hypothetical protein [Candidatus Nitrosotenuis sp.]